MKVLFLTHRLPYAPDRGDRVRAFHLIRQMRTYADVHLISLVHSREEAGHASDLEGLTSSVHVAETPRVRALARAGLALPTRTPLTHVLLDAPHLRPSVDRVVSTHKPDVVLAFCSGMARIAFEPPLSSLPVVVDMVDVDSAKWRDLSGRTSPPARWIYAREARALSQFEAWATQHAGATMVVNEREREALAALAPGARIDVVPNGVDPTRLRPEGPPAESSQVIFCGVMNYAPNEQGALWMATRVWPLIRERFPDARLALVGTSPSARLQALATAGSGVTVVGHVADVRPHLWASAVSVAPLLTARGMQNKVLEALAAGLPCVVTPAVAAGLPDVTRQACAVADSPEAFAAAVADRLAMTPVERRALAQQADLSTLSWERALSPVRSILERAIDARRNRMAAPSVTKLTGSSR